MRLRSLGAQVATVVLITAASASGCADSQPSEPSEITGDPDIDGTVIDTRIRGTLLQILIEAEPPTEPQWHDGRIWFIISESTVIERELPDGSTVPIPEDEIEIHDRAKAWMVEGGLVVADPPRTRAAKIVILPE